MQLDFHLNPDGSFDVLSQTQILLQDAFPAVNGRPLRVLRTEMPEKNTVLFHTASGGLLLRFDRVDGGALRICASLAQYTAPVHKLSLLGDALLPHFTGMFQQSGSMGGPCGYHAAPLTAAYDSCGLVSLGTPEGYLTLYATDHRRFESSFSISPAKDGPLCSACFQLENCNCPEEQLPALYLRFDTALEDGLNAAAAAIGREMGARLHREPAYHWCSWYYCYHNFDQAQLEDYTAGFNRVNVKPRFIQIDAGTCPALGDWLIPNERWPKGFDGAFETIQKAGFAPGIWIGPFMVGNRSRLFLEHPDWILRDLMDKPVVKMVMDNEPKLWGYQDEEFYCLDTSHPDAMEYLRTVFRTMRRWGAELFKTDFMQWGINDSTRVKRHTPGKTSVEYFRDVLQMIREEIGDESYWLGCIAPYFPFIGYADGMRIGGDVGSCWEGAFNPQNMIMSVAGSSHLNHSLFQIDPDALLLRDFHIRLNDGEITALARLAAMSGGCVYTSDPLHQIREDRRKLFTYLKPDKRRKASRPFQDDSETRCIVTVQKNADKRKALVLTFNQAESALLENYPLTGMGLAAPMYAYDLDTGARSDTPVSSLLAKTEPHGSRLFLLSANPTEVLDNNRLWGNLGD